MKTIDYQYYHCDFPEFNVAQQAVVPFFDKDVNLICALSTGIGKTAIAECIFGYHLSQNKKSKVVYIAPLKSIGSEKQERWSENNQFKPHGILLCNGDNIPKNTEWIEKRLILITYESLDSKTRNKNNEWIKDVECFVFDESHTIGQTDRGDKIEACLMRITHLNPNARIVFLSGTMGNATELAKWVKQLNNKETKCIQSDWKPVKTITSFQVYDDSLQWIQIQKEKFDTIYGIIKDVHQSEKIIIFVHSKKTGKALIEFLRSKKIQCGFHNASIPHNARKRLEEVFTDQYSGFNVLVATSTLSSGVNL